MFSLPLKAFPVPYKKEEGIFMKCHFYETAGKSLFSSKTYSGSCIFPPLRLVRIMFLPFKMLGLKSLAWETNFAEVQSILKTVYEADLLFHSRVWLSDFKIPLIYWCRYCKLKTHWAYKNASVSPANSSVHGDKQHPSFILVIYSLRYKVIVDIDLISNCSPCVIHQ